MYSHELIYAKNYNIIQKFQNGCIMSSISQISEDYIFLGKSYTAKTLTNDYEYINKITKSVDKAPDA